MIRTLPLDRLRLDGDTQSRKEIDMTIVAEYAADMENGADFPPLQAVHDGKHYWLWDGFHRYHGACKAGKKEAKVEVRTGTLADAQWLSYGANGEHGFRRKPEDIRAVVEKALRHEYAATKSLREIASQVKVSHMTVQRVRTELESAVTELQVPERKGRDGKTYDTTNIGKRKPEPPPEPSFLPPEQPPSEPQAAVPLPTVEPPVEQKPSLGAYVTLERWNAMPKPERADVLSWEGDARFNNQGDNENIEWALWSWNPVTGCLHNCPYCYARDIAERFYEQKFAPTLWPGRLRAPHNTPFPENKAREWMGHKNVFVCSMADLFGRWVPREWIDAVLREVKAAAQWNFLFLTKFPIRMAEFKFPDNAWVGTTVDCQARVANAEKAFRKVQAGVKWLSIEPLIEPLQFSDLGAFDWLVLGGASRSTQTPEWNPPYSWIKRLLDDAQQAGTEVYLKTNCRIRQYPGVAEPVEAPEALRYLPTDR